jgi:putative transposase
MLAQARAPEVLIPQDRQHAGGATEGTHPGVKEALEEIWGAEEREHAEQAAEVFGHEYGAKWPRPRKITGDLEELRAVYDCPAEHCVSRLPKLVLRG